MSGLIYSRESWHLAAYYTQEKSILEDTVIQKFVVFSDQGFGDSEICCIFCPGQQ